MIDNKELNKLIRNAAISHGLCRQWRAAWFQDWNAQKLVNKFYEGIDFFLKERFISTNFIKESMPQCFLRDNAILVDDRYSVINPSQRVEDSEGKETHYAITLGSTEAKIRMNARNIATCYVCDRSAVTVIARNNSFVIVHLCDNSSLSVETYDEAHVTVIVHTRNASLTTKGSVSLKKEMNWLDD